MFRHVSPRARLGVVAACALLAAAVLASCGGSGDNRTVLIPPNGEAIGNLICTSSISPQTNMIAQGQSVLITYTLRDANINVAGANLNVAFDVVGGSVPNPPNETDQNGQVTVVFVADDDFTGPGRVRLVQPDARLICDVTFTVFQPACILRARVEDGMGNDVTPEDACGTTELNVQRNAVRIIVYRVSRPNPATNVEGPVPGAFLRLTATGMTFSEMVIGPTDAGGEISQQVTPFPTGSGEATITAEVEPSDANADGVDDSLPCNSCTIGFDIINPICDDNGDVLVPVYRDNDGSVKAAPLRPGETADVTANFSVGGAPLVNHPVLVDAQQGALDTPCGPVQPSGESTAPRNLQTDAMGNVCVKYVPPIGFAGGDTVTFQSSTGNTTCTQTATVAVVTCDFTVTFNPPPQAGQQSTITVTLVPGSADPDTIEGEPVTVSVTGGQITEQPPTFPLQNNGMGGLGFMATYNVTPNFSGPAQISLSFPQGYPCSTVTKNFAVAP